MHLMVDKRNVESLKCPDPKGSNQQGVTICICVTQKYAATKLTMYKHFIELLLATYHSHIAIYSIFYVHTYL